MKTKNTLQKIAKKSLIYSTILGTILCLGFLSYIGTIPLELTWLSLPPLVWGIIAFMFSIIFDVLVAKQNVEQAFEKLINLGEDYLKQALAAEILDAIVKEAKKTGEALPEELEKYVEAKEALEEVEARVDRLKPIDWLLSFSDCSKLHAEEHAQKRILQNIQKRFLHSLTSAENDLGLTEEVLKKARDTLAYELQRRNIRKHVLWIVIAAVLAGVSALFSALCASQKGLADIGIRAGSTLSWALCWPIGIFAGIGCILYLYNNLTQLMHERALYPSSTSKRPYSYYFIRLVVSLVVAFITGAIFWTWFTTSVEIGNQMFSWGNIGVSAFMGIFAGAMLIPTLLWNLTNAFNTIALLEEKWKKFKFSSVRKALSERLREDWREHKARGAYLAYLNPLRIIEKLVRLCFYLIALIGHSVSAGLTADRFGPVPPKVVIVTTALNEAVTHAAYLEQGHAHDAEEHIQEEEEKNAHDARYYPIEKLPEAEHTHIDVAGILLVPILLSLKTIRFIIDLLFYVLAAPFLKTSLQEAIHHSYKKIFSSTLTRHSPHTPSPSLPSESETALLGNILFLPAIFSGQHTHYDKSSTFEEIITPLEIGALITSIAIYIAKTSTKTAKQIPSESFFIAIFLALIACRTAKELYSATESCDLHTQLQSRIKEYTHPTTNAERKEILLGEMKALYYVDAQAKPEDAARKKLLEAHADLLAELAKRADATQEEKDFVAALLHSHAEKQTEALLHFLSASTAATCCLLWKLGYTFLSTGIAGDITRIACILSGILKFSEIIRAHTVFKQKKETAEKREQCVTHLLNISASKSISFPEKKLNIFHTPEEKKQIQQKIAAFIWEMHNNTAPPSVFSEEQVHASIDTYMLTCIYAPKTETALMQFLHPSEKYADASLQKENTCHSSDKKRTEIFPRAPATIRQSLFYHASSKTKQKALSQHIPSTIFPSMVY